MIIEFWVEREIFGEGSGEWDNVVFDGLDMRDECEKCIFDKEEL